MTRTSDDPLKPATYADRMACLRCGCGACPYEAAPRPGFDVMALLRRAVPSRRILAITAVRATVAGGLAVVAALAGGWLAWLAGALAHAFALLALIGLLYTIESAVIGGLIDDWLGHK